MLGAAVTVALLCALGWGRAAFDGADLEPTCLEAPAARKCVALACTLGLCSFASAFFAALLFVEVEFRDGRPPRRSKNARTATVRFWRRLCCATKWSWAAVSLSLSFSSAVRLAKSSACTSNSDLIFASFAENSFSNVAFSDAVLEFCSDFSSSSDSINVCNKSLGSCAECRPGFLSAPVWRKVNFPVPAISLKRCSRNHALLWFASCCAISASTSSSGAFSSISVDFSSAVATNSLAVVTFDNIPSRSCLSLLFALTNNSHCLRRRVLALRSFATALAILKFSLSVFL
mmetsp:Transcript_118024/g.333844  ORF Transcript_118024/g.333844 Transcript_118024/m.333844 type:complete len:289 (+) Transcript_118024:193-1059(+)